MDIVPLIGFAPDLDPATPGALVDCASLLPGVNGMEAAPSLVSAGLPALASACKGVAVMSRLDNTRRMFAGTAGNLYEAVGGSWTSVGSGYSVSTDSRWRFAQFGNVSLATNKETVMQGATTGSFSALTSAPKAAIVEVLNNQIFAFDTHDGTYGDSPDRWWCSAIGNENDWTPAASTQAATGRLLDAPGAITAGKRLGDIIVAYKERAMFVGQYVGVPMIWDWRRVPGNIGTPCHEAVITTGTAHYFIGPDDFYVFDGSRPVPMQSPLRRWFFSTLDEKYAYRTQSAYDAKNGRLFWWFVSKSGGGTVDTGICYHLKSNKWGRLDAQIEAAVEYFSPGVTYDGLGSLYSTYDDLPTGISYDSPFWTSGTGTLAVFTDDHVLRTFTGTPGESSLTGWLIGDGDAFVTLSGIRPRFIVAPSSTTLEHTWSNLHGDALTPGGTASYSANGNYDLIWSARWHRVKLNFSGPVTIAGYGARYVIGGYA